MDLGKLFHIGCLLGGAIFMTVFVLLTLVAHEYRRWVNFQERYILYRHMQRRQEEREKERVLALKAKQRQHEEILRQFTEGEIG